MAKECCESKADDLAILRAHHARVLKIVMAINLAMFGIEAVAGWLAHSTSLLADSLDMFGDATVYAVSLYVLHQGDQKRARAAFLKGIIICLFGVGILIETYRKLAMGVIPEPGTMGVIGTLALCANLICLWLLTRYRDDDLNMRSVWICSRNDIVANSGVLVAALLVHWTHSNLPDVLIGAGIAVFFFRSAVPILFESWRVLHPKQS